ncbi:MAG: HD domain-containing protein [Candidatus Eremiobacteraeota bacterium]|nr:HD domain-containing protein [Candidatus Eremiobacteraeota bacterium]
MTPPKSEKIIRDPIHGDIPLDVEHEIPLLDTPEMQRLRGIKQLGTAHLVYPSAVHTRFEHSLGTCFVAQRIIETIEGQQRKSLFSDEEKHVARAAALLHDVSHIPFGHTFEDERQIFDRHDTPDRIAYFLNTGTVAKVLRDMGISAQVTDVLHRTGSNPALSEIINGTICADLLDYLARDGYFCGISHGYDQRIFRYFRIQNGVFFLDAQKEGIIREDVLSEIINLLRLRYFMSERVYFHHAKTASGAMISKAVEIGVKNGLTKGDLFPLRDEGLLSLLSIKFGKLKTIQMLLELLMTRKLYKRCYILTRRLGPQKQQDLISRYHRNIHLREEAEDFLTKKLRLREGELIIYCPSSDMALKEANVMVKIDSSPPRMLSTLKIPEIEVLMEKHRDLWKFYVFIAPGLTEKMKMISRACEEYFCESNHLPALESGQLFFGF